VLDDGYYDIVEIEDRWYEPEAMYFRVRTTEGKRYILRYSEGAERAAMFGRSRFRTG
jgi:hypothetical protein